MKVLKFGGTSVGTAENLLNVKRIVEANDDSVIVVVSALGGLTDKLIQTSRLAEAGDVAFEKQMTEIIERHLFIISQVFPAGTKRDDLVLKVNELLSELHQCYTNVFASRELSDAALATIVSYGERISSVIVASMIEDAVWYDALSFIKTEFRHHKHKLSGDVTDQLIGQCFQSLPKVALVPGFISTDVHTGEITNLGRGGSDYTAAILAAALDADCLEIWTDVDGFMTADPRIIQQVNPIQELSYNEAEELCNYGAKVVYPPTIYPVWYKNIPVLIKNTMNAAAPGTYIRQVAQTDVVSVKGISSIADTCLITITGLREENVTELWRNLAQVLEDNCIQVLLSVASPSEQQLQLGVKKDDLAYAESVLQKFLSVEAGRLFKLDITKGLSTVALVGNLAHESLAILPDLCNLLERKGIAILASSLEHSGLTFAFMVESAYLQTALKVAHTAAIENL